LSKKVLFIQGAKHASGYYRMGQACQLLQKMNYIIDILFFDTIDPVTLKASKSILSPNSPGLTHITLDLTKADTVVFQMIWHDALNTTIKKLKNLGITTAMEVDDDYLNLPASNPSFHAFHPKCNLVKNKDGKLVFNLQQQKYKKSFNRYVRDRKSEEKTNFALDNLKKAMSLVDFLQVSTPELSQLYSKYNDHIVVLENCIENELYDSVPKVKNTKPVIGWFGTKTHSEDLRIVDGCIPDNAKLLIAGFPDIKDTTLFKYHEDIEFVPPYELKDLPQIVKQCDIGIIPLVECKFNDGKSDLKGLEFAAGSIPTVASDVAPYRRWIRHGENGYLAKGNKSKFWIRYLNELVNNQELREKMGKEAKIDAENRDIKSYIHKWVEVYFK
jgi:glycosyltransferase involved in cell wall biosynthesis